MEYTPFKCPDCSVWWRTETHKCASVSTGAPVAPPAKKLNVSFDGWLSCPKCDKNVSKFDWHTCKSYDEYYKRTNKKDYPHDPENPKTNR